MDTGMDVTAAVIERHGAFLIARRRNEGRYGGAWEFPGGKVEPGESPESCLRRELLEELGVEIRIGVFLGRFAFRSALLDIDLLAYRAEIAAGVVSLRDHDDVRWVRGADLRTFDFAEPDLPLVEILMGGEPL